MIRFAIAALLLALAGCSSPQPARPAMWEVSGPHGERGWLFGTIHLLAKEAGWRSPTVSRALDGADLLVLEVAAIDDTAAMHNDFEAAAHSPGLPPLRDRVSAPLRASLDRVLAENHLSAGQFADTETWAAALILASTQNKDADAGNGIDRAIAAATPDLPRAELEGATAQFAIFDRLPEADQRVILEATLRDDPGEASPEQLAAAWRKGDMDLIARQTSLGFMADPVIRKALFTDRNLAWDSRIEAMLRDGRHPFVAVGAAHLAGPDGLPAMLAAHGWKVARIQ